MRKVTAAVLGALCLPLGERASLAQPMEHDEHKYSEWQTKKTSAFVASASDVGIIYGRPHATLGYGAPFWQFVGFDGYALATNEFAAVYAGWRASLPFLDVQFGRRWSSTYRRRFLPKRETYVADDLSMRDGSERSAYQVMELEVTPLAPLFGGVVFAELHPIWIQGHGDQNVYEEVIRAVVVPPFAMRTRLGFLEKLGPGGMWKLGAMTEYLVTPGRPKNTTRVGPLALVTMNRHFEALFTVTLPVSSPDDLGLYAGSYGFLGLRYRFAERF